MRKMRLNSFLKVTQLVSGHVGIQIESCLFLTLKPLSYSAYIIYKEFSIPSLPQKMLFLSPSVTLSLYSHNFISDLNIALIDGYYPS